MKLYLRKASTLEGQEGQEIRGGLALKADGGAQVDQARSAIQHRKASTPGKLGGTDFALLPTRDLISDLSYVPDSSTGPRGYS